MNTFGEFLFALRKEKGMTQAELADMLGVTNKAVSKWETGEAMPETSLLVPLSRIFGVTVDELLEGRRAEADESKSEKTDGDGAASCNASGNASDKASDDGLPFELKQHLFTRGKDDEANRTLSEKICGVVCATVFLCGLAAYLLIGALANAWHPYWVILPVCALSCGIIGIVFDLCNRVKREKKAERGENPYTGAVCGIFMLSCIIAYLCIGAFAGLWHPYWLIIVGGVVFCGVVGAIGGIFVHSKRDK